MDDHGALFTIDTVFARTGSEQDRKVVPGWANLPANFAIAKPVESIVPYNTGDPPPSEIAIVIESLSIVHCTERISLVLVPERWPQVSSSSYRKGAYSIAVGVLL